MKGKLHILLTPIRVRVRVGVGAAVRVRGQTSYAFDANDSFFLELHPLKNLRLLRNI